MAERVTDPEALAVWEALSFRFDSGQLNQWMNGEVWIITAGVDYPIKWPWVTLKIRLRQNASARGGRLRIGRLTHLKTEIQFFPRGSGYSPFMRDPRDGVVTEADESQPEPMEGEAPGA